MTAVTLDDIRAARDSTAAHVRLTPIWPAPALEAITGAPVGLKCENLQVTGSFKIRGATNFVRLLSAAECRRGLVAASAGNHAQGIAVAGRSHGATVTVVMPVTAPLAKITACRQFGATVVLHGTNLEEARTEALRIAQETGAIHVPPFDSDAVIAGQGTIGLEILEQAPDVREILVPAGGGGLLGGIAVAVKSLRPEVRVVGVQATAMAGICRSLEAGRPVSVAATRTIADGVAVGAPSARTFDLVQRYVDDMVHVGDDATAHAIVFLMERNKLLAEGAGALAVAAIQSGAYRPKGPAVAVVSGGNIDINLLGSIVRRGLVDAGRYRSLAIEVSDTPGELATVAKAIADAGGNILEVDHNREAPGMPIGVAVLELLIEVNGREHFDDVIQTLRERGLRGVPGSHARLATEAARQRHETE